MVPPMSMTCAFYCRDQSLSFTRKSVDVRYTTPARSRTMVMCWQTLTVTGLTITLTNVRPLLVPSFLIIPMALAVLYISTVL